MLEQPMEIGEPKRTIVVEPLEDPVPRETPREPDEQLAEPPPRDPEKVPA
jgi:hypothetical protein